MFKIISLSVFLIFFLFAAGSKAQNFNAAVVAGMTATQVAGDELAGFNKAGICAGGLVSLKLSDKLTARFEMLYIEKGSKKNPDPVNNDLTQYLLRLNYIEVPLMLEYQYKTKLYLETGISIGSLISSKEERDGTTVPDYRSFHKTEFSFNAGMLYPFSERFLFSWRFSNSILPVREHASGATLGLNRGQYNTVMCFTLRYCFFK